MRGPPRCVEYLYLLVPDAVVDVERELGRHGPRPANVGENFGTQHAVGAVLREEEGQRGM